MYRDLLWNLRQIRLKSENLDARAIETYCGILGKLI